MRLPVHCCCDPTKRLGSVEVPGYAKGPIRFVMRAPASWPRLDAATSWEGEVLHTEIATLAFGADSWPAVKSGHRPLEDWLRVPTFEREP